VAAPRAGSQMPPAQHTPRITEGAHHVSRKKRASSLERAADIVRQVGPTAVAAMQMLIELIWRSGGRGPGCA
jgi:hypothetical protein